jgi:radical SAM protein with 4Fe4S-binding SPASM domain
MIRCLIKNGLIKFHQLYLAELRRKPQLRNLFFECTLRCNAKCMHCGSRAYDKNDLIEEIDATLVKDTLKLIAKKYNSKAILISVTGGEPLLRKDIFDIMKYARELGFQWGMTTNGMLITDKIITKMNESSMSTISISIDGLAETHDNFRRVKGSFNKIIKNIKLLKQADILEELQVTTVITKLNINELDELYDLMVSLKIDSWRILNVDSIGRAKDNKSLLLSSKDIKHLLDFIKEKRKKGKLKVTYSCSNFLGLDYELEVRDGFFVCTSGITTASILHNGDIFVCPNVNRKLELIQGNIKHDDFIEIWENKFQIFRNKQFINKSECRNCNWEKICLGGSLHTWNFNQNQQGLCLINEMKEEH